MQLFRKKPPPLPRRDLLRAKPVRNEKLTCEENSDGEIVLGIPRRKTWWINTMSRMFYVPSRRTVVLDRIGSFLWGYVTGRTRWTTSYRRSGPNTSWNARKRRSPR